jgi:hypothetical protein
MTDDELREVAAEWLAPIDQVIADLMDKSERMTIGAFIREVEQVIERIPQMYGMLNSQALISALEDEIGKAMLKGIEDGNKDG